MKAMIAASQGITFEKQTALGNLTAKDVLEVLNYQSLYQILDKNIPNSSDSIINKLHDFHLCEQEGEKWSITNLGAILFANRLSDLPPQSRNEQLAQMMFQLGICERRGSGIDRAIEAVEKMFLPAVKFTKSEQHTRVFMFPQKGLKDMTKQEKISACYQHACLMYEDGEAVNNQSVRERFELNKNDSSIASRIISDTVEAGLIKPADNETTSKKYMTYIPFYG